MTIKIASDVSFSKTLDTEISRMHNRLVVSKLDTQSSVSQSREQDLEISSSSLCFVSTFASLPSVFPFGVCSGEFQ